MGSSRQVACSPGRFPILLGGSRTGGETRLESTQAKDEWGFREWMEWTGRVLGSAGTAHSVRGGRQLLAASCLAAPSCHRKLKICAPLR
jgi:hypothetical protein